MKVVLSIIALVLLAIIVPFLIPDVGRRGDADPERNLPWQIQVDAQGGSQVFGLTLGESTLAEVGTRFGAERELAIIATPQEAGGLEVFFNQAALGFVTARVILVLETTPEQIVAMRERALKAEYMESTTRKITLHPSDIQQAEALPIRSISVIPTVNLDEATVVQRFGTPAERIAVSEKRVHLLYPERGLDVIVDAEGKELLQYVAPRQFAALRAPLVAKQP